MIYPGLVLLYLGALAVCTVLWGGEYGGMLLVFGGIGTAIMLALLKRNGR